MQYQIKCWPSLYFIKGWEDNTSKEDNTDGLVGAQYMIGGSPRCPGGSPIHEWRITKMSWWEPNA